VFDGEKHVSIASVPGMEARTIIASAVSKTYSWTGGRVGWAVYPTVEEAKVHRNLNINYVASIPPYNQVGARAALESPESEVAIKTMNDAFQRRRDQVVAGLNAIEGVHCQLPKGAFYVFPNIEGVVESLGVVEAYNALPADLRCETSPATLFQLFLLHHYHVATMDRRSFGTLESEGQHFLRLSVATGAKDLAEAVARISEASEDTDGFRQFVRSGVKLDL
jgi:aspartate/methionine/tyrosine aminotransferase